MTGIKQSGINTLALMATIFPGSTIRRDYITDSREHVLTSDNPSTDFREKLSTYVLPLALALAAWLAQSSYARIAAQLDRIESRQSSDMIALAELKYRVLQLENALLYGLPTAKREPPQQTDSGAKKAPNVYSQS